MGLFNIAFFGAVTAPVMLLRYLKIRMRAVVLKTGGNAFSGKFLMFVA